MKGKVPHFFKYAKDKEDKQVAKRNSSCVNRLFDIIKVNKFDFSKKELGTFSYQMLMSDPDTVIGEQDEEIIRYYYELASAVNMRMTSDGEKNNYNQVFLDIKNKLLQADPDIIHLTDILVLQLFHKKKARHKVVFWNCFGDVVLENLRKNVDIRTTMCDECGTRYIRASYEHNLCPKCYTAYRKKYKAKLEKERRLSRKNA